jgi:hypothetical protein
MATATMKSAAKAQGTVRVLTEAPRVLHVRTGRPESVVEHRRDEAVVLFQGQGDARSTAVSLIQLPQPVIASLNPAPHLCSCPEWHVLRLFGGGRGRVSFETCHEQLADSTISGVCQVCGYGLRGDSASH